MKRLLAILVVLGAFLSPAALAFAAPGSAGAASPGGPSVQLFDQTPWLQGPGSYRFRIGLAGMAPTDQVQVTVFDQLITRTSFDQAAGGKVNDIVFYRQAVPLGDLVTDPAGGFDVDLPVNRVPPAGGRFATVQIGETGVFPVQLSIIDPSGVPRGEPLTTFIVYAQHTVSAATIKPLSAALIVPVGSEPRVGPTGGLSPPGAQETSRLGRLAGVLSADTSVPASVLASPVTLDELAVSGTTTDRSVLSQLNGTATSGPFEVLPSTYSPVSLGGLQTVLPGEVEPQLTTGSATLKSVFGTAPDGRTWVVDGPLDGATLGVLIAHHVRQVIVPNEDLTPLPGEIQITFAGSTYLDYAGYQLQVISADRALTSAFTRPVPPVLAANDLLAELAMIYTEAPNAISPRGLAVLPPPGWSASPTFVQTVLAGLRGNPLVAGVTASQLFSSMGQPQGVRYLASDQPGGAVLDPSAVGAIAAARTQIFDLGQLLGQSSQVTELGKQLLLAESSTLNDGQRRSVLRAIGAATARVQNIASLPPATTITLTATKGEIPLTILAAGSLHPRIQLHLRSQRLIFRPFSPRGGHCRVISDTEEVCSLTLAGQNTTLKVPVETRSSGVFPLDVSIEVPGTGRVLAKDQDTVRSTAVSGVAVIVIIVALVALIVWWGRDLRRGRRPKGMVPSPLADPDGAQVTAGDPDVDGFFERPPPDFGDGNGGGSAMSPSVRSAGPSTTSATNGQNRESREQ